MLTKSCTVQVKAVGSDDGLEEGVFEAIVSVFGNVDSYGDKMILGAFKDTLDEWAASGDPIPSYYSHRMDDPDYNIGEVLEAKELQPGDPDLPPKLKDFGGLYVKVKVDLHDEAKKARQVYRLLKGRRLTQFSFAYDVLEYAIVKSEDEEQMVWELRKVKLYEVGPTPIGANQETELLAVKAAGYTADRIASEVKAGRAISAENESELKSVRDAINRALESTLDTEDESKASGSEPDKVEVPDGAKAEVPTREPSALTLLQLELGETEFATL